MDNSERPFVSIFMLTYNHGKYIAQALDSILMQEVDFNYEIVVGEDCSSDNTREILLKYAEKYPDKFNLLLHSTNVGANKNQVLTLEACSGKYIAMLEGDDFWTNPFKLKEQVSFLETNPGYSMCFTNCSVVNEKGLVIEESFVPKKFQKDFLQLEIIRDYCPPTLTVLFRNNLINKFPDSFYTIKNGDYFLYALVSSFGKVGYINSNTATYRRHEGGVWTNLNMEKQLVSNLNTKLALFDFFKPKYKKEFFHSINWYYARLCSDFIKQKRYRDFAKFYKEFLSVSLLNFNKEFIAFTFSLIFKRGSLYRRYKLN